MGWKGNLIEPFVWAASRAARNDPGVAGRPREIFVLRNNDIGDLLVTTPLFDALRRRFPQARIVAGIGGWNRQVLANNPFVDEVVEVNAPWTNKYVKDQSWPAVLRYIARSEEVRRLARRRFDVGIDIVGSHVGAALLMRLGIPYRIGVRGYRGGHTGFHRWIRYDEQTHVGRAALALGELLGATDLPPVRPQIFLTADEAAEGESAWLPRDGSPPRKRLVLGIGGGFAEKCWPVESFAALVKQLDAQGDWEVIVLGGAPQRDEAERVAAAARCGKSLAGQASLRQTFAIVAAADLVVTNPSMIMHVAGAFGIETYVVMGEYFPDARQHDVQWGYPDTCISLGRGQGRTGIYSPAEVATIIVRRTAVAATEVR
jgi:ADP-heptose:LPS heptosyltransferase